MADDTSPLWCAKDNPHSPHSQRNRYNGTDYCSGRPEHPTPDAPRDLDDVTVRLRHFGDIERGHTPLNAHGLLIEAADAIASLRADLAAAQQALAEREAMIEESIATWDDYPAGDDRIRRARDILTASPSTALREHDARVLEEAADSMKHPANAPYEVWSSGAGGWLRARAAAIRAGEVTT